MIMIIWHVMHDLVRFRCTPRPEGASRSKYARQRVRVGGRFVPRAVIEAQERAAAATAAASAKVAAVPQSAVLARLQRGLVDNEHQLLRRVPAFSAEVAALAAAASLKKSGTSHDEAICAS